LSSVAPEAREPDRLARACYVVSVALVAAGVFHLGVFALGDRPWHGPLSWRKPATFGLSFGATLATVTWVTSYLRMTPRTRALLMGVFAVDCVVEVAGITLQAWRNQPSHLNTSSPANASVAYTLAAGGAVLVAVLGTFAVIAVRGRVDASPSMVLAIRTGFVLLVAGLASGIAMIAYGTAVMRSGDTQRAYDVAGFLKAFHGVTLHGVLVLPALAWWLGGRVLDESRRTSVVGVAIGGYAVAAAAVLVWSLVQL
jgi:hypothetical protein